MRCDAVSDHVHVLYAESDQPMGRARVQKLATRVKVVHMEGAHIEALQRLASEEPARMMASIVSPFLLEDPACS